MIRDLPGLTPEEQAEYDFARRVVENHPTRCLSIMREYIFCGDSGDLDADVQDLVKFEKKYTGSNDPQGAA